MKPFGWLFQRRSKHNEGETVTRLLKYRRRRKARSKMAQASRRRNRRK